MFLEERLSRDGAFTDALEGDAAELKTLMGLGNKEAAEIEEEVKTATYKWVARTRRAAFQRRGPDGRCCASSARMQRPRAVQPQRDVLGVTREGARAAGAAVRPRLLPRSLLLPTLHPKLKPHVAPAGGCCARR